MKQLTCEMCGGTDLIKQDGVFVCQNCGMKYSVEEAKKMMVEGTVDVQGVVKIDDSDELKKLYQAARNARETSDYIIALRHYENISSKDPDSWEALFYLVILKTNSIKNGEIGSAALNVTNCLNKVFQLIKTNVTEDGERKKCVKEVIDQCFETSLGLSIASQNFYESVTKGNGVMMLTGIVGAVSSISSTGNAIVENQTRYAYISDIMRICGDEIELNFGLEDNDYKEYAISSWKHMLEVDTIYKGENGSHIFKDEKLGKYVDKIKEYEPEYSFELKSKLKEKESTTPEGCYVATAVYGSYDCPEVWTLRRYRDYSLAETCYGRAFIHTYYVISPTLVKWFGHTEWFKKMWKGKLDRMVKNLQEQGFEATPYEDRNWR